MDTMRGSYGSLAESGSYDQADDDTGRDAPPAAIGQDERRMQVRAYNHWASLLNDRNFPAIEDLEPDNLPDFGPYSVLLDFSSGIENPGISYLGDKLGEECDAGDEDLQTLSDVPSRSLLTRITDHYMQILANQAPIGFEAEFVNQRGATIAYRGILLPFSSDDDTIDFIYGVINWKELADAAAADELLLEIDQALEAKPAPHRDDDVPLTDWADGPAAFPANDLESDAGTEESVTDEFVAADHLGEEENLGEEDAGDLPMPSFGYDDDEDEDEEDDATTPVLSTKSQAAYGSLLKMPIDLSHTAALSDSFDLSPAAALSDSFDLPHTADQPDPFDLAASVEVTEIELPEIDPSEMGLGDWLAAAREMAAAAHSSEDRTRNALYDAIGRAYDFSLAAADAAGEFEELLTDSGLTMQDRAPMTPVVKLVFGADYDKTRLTEYAAALTHAHRLQLPLGALGDFLGEHEGGLKGVVKAERRLRKQEAGKAVEPLDAPRHALARKLRSMPAQGFEAIAPDGSEFALVMIRRTETGEVVMLGEVPEDVALVERAARKLIG